jgi:hypothetical protein
VRRILGRALVAACLLLLVAGCSALTRVAYNNAAIAGAWTVDDWFDLRDGQREWVKERFARLVAWHRANELPAYERLLQDTAARAATGLTADDARRIHGELRVLYYRVVRKAIPDMADFLLQVHPEQVAHLERKFAQDNARAVKESVKGTPRERREARAERYTDRIEDWTGRLSGAQRDLVRARLEPIPDLVDEWMGDRRHRQAETLALIRARPARDAAIDALTRLLVDTDSWRRPEYVAKLKARDEHVFAMIAALDATLTPGQRGHLHRRLAGYAADVAYLMVAN